MEWEWLGILDHALAGQYGLTTGQEDFIIRYDIQYRLGAQSEEEE